MKIGELVKFTARSHNTYTGTETWVVNTGIVVSTWTVPYKNRVQSVDILYGDKIISRLVSSIEVINESR